MKQRINRYIPIALGYITQSLADPQNKVDERYDGYAASLGPAIITSGLKAAIAFYTDVHRSDENNINEPRRYHILQAIANILTTDGETLDAGANNGLLTHLLVPANNTSTLKEKIMDATVAVKLAFRNFKQVKKT